MTTNPADLVQVRAYCAQRTGQPLVALGIAGDDAHAASGGYHIGGKLVSVGDYSRAESPRDRTVTTTDASAFDLGGAFPRFREISLGIVAACKRQDHRARDIREVIYTPDGVNVLRWDRLSIRSSGDTSHRTHTHISFFRDSAGRRHLDDNCLGLLRELFEGNGDDDMSWDQAVTILQGTNTGGYADAPVNTTTPAWAKQAVGYNLKSLHAKVDALTAAATAEKVRDAAQFTEIAALRAAFSTLAGNATGTPLDTAAVLAAAREEGQKTRELVERHYQDEMAERETIHKAELAGLLAQVQALQAATGGN